MLLPAARARELQSACHLLFGVPFAASLPYLDRLRPAELKAQYRRRALESHPDRAHVVGQSAEELGELFKSVTGAYDTLRRHLGEQTKAVANAPPRRAGPRARAAAPKSAPPRAGRESGHRPLPDMELRFAQYLYYSGRISWQTMIQAVCWQRRQRPVFGELARTRGYVSTADLERVMRERRAGERVGEAAVRVGLLRPQQCRLVLEAQRAQEPKIGAFFVGQQGLCPRDLEAALAEQREHNAACRAKRQGPKAARR